MASDMSIIELSGYADFEWAVQLNRFSLNLVGLWPTASPREKLISNLRLFSIVTAFICVCTTPSLLSLGKAWGDMTAMIDNILFTLPLVMQPVKMLILWWKREALSPLMAMIAYDWIKSKSSNERDVMLRRARNARVIITCSYVIMCSTLTVLITVSGLGYTLRYATNVTNTGRPLPVQAYYIYDTSTSPQYEITFFVQCVVLILIGLPYTGIDNFIGLLIFHICGQLENLTNRLYRMRKSEDFHTALRMNVMDHIRLIRSVTIVEDSFTLMLLLIFFSFGAMFCVYGFLVVTVIFEEKNVPVKRAGFLIMAICTAFLHMCVYCAVGELLVIKVMQYIAILHNARSAKYEEVYNAVYECEWYMLETKQSKNLILLMIRMNKPLYITAGKILPMTMSTFCSILKTSGGYISVLLANQN